MEKKSLLLLVLIPVQQSKSDDIIRSKSSAGDQYRTNWDACFGKSNPAQTN